MKLKLKGFLHPTSTQARVLVCLSAAIIAAIDLAIPDNINVATFYFFVIVLSGWTRSIKWLWGSTFVCLVLTYAGLIYGGGPAVFPVTWVDWLNRSMTAVALA